MFQYQTKVVSVGEYAKDSLEDDMVILFGRKAPLEVQNYCFIHSESFLVGEINHNTTLLIGDFAYVITAVGDAANLNLAKLGHVTLKFDGRREPELPGTIHLLGPKLVTLNEGDSLIFG
ncbi:MULTISPECIES: PTS glucitol/sorbitol transporter subunit IIA [Vibrio]|uniref:PTS sorbitol transporter subunit IIA n=2 Tax=Vibrio harveyi TaxID=669 RepID=A0A8B3D7C5_VIBHA|nr:MULTISPECIES: PTS glucitol/sorbitol transporter subunit IIA [Vibrio]AWB02026.1 PTS sorbitol transporter subunit IIA [Vibrio harveyi]EKO3869506.1 PTS glucitol/sorbitol transporter subunit IIA [Vibrio harveyi]ELE7134533.1 PTS glucitol/sorbitol transporter subunit IIA [Vibrio harveyi]ELI6425815.1 PTS glucitol/sorbitol transporter subunit IIA [Vibrio harveyi]ELY1985260.1 PTS glucitol/sorbitol transporter subunit IIA [Vibrio harveyi]